MQGKNLVIEKADFFRKIQTWPLNDVLNYKGWLNNFSTAEEKEIASYLLDFFIFYPRSIVDQMLKTVIGYCGYYLSNVFPDWHHDDFKKRCYYSFIPGETNNPTDSGHVYVRKLRNELKIPEKQILYHKELFSLLKNNKESIPVIFVDDFVGSGAQCDIAWNKHMPENDSTFHDIAQTSNHHFIYAPLVTNQIGYKRIEKKCMGLKLITCHILDHRYNLFHPDCMCWKNDKNLYNRGIGLILDKSQELGIPFTNGRSVTDVKGFGEQGLAIAFDDAGVPDAIPPFFYWCSVSKWKPLIKKEYKR